MDVKISGSPKEIADLALALQDRLTSDLRSDFIELAKAVARGGRTTENQNCNSDKADFAAAQKIITESSKKVHEEKFLIDRIKGILLENEKIFKGFFCNLLQEHDFSNPESRDFFYKRSAETIINAVSKSIIREIWKI